MFDTAPKSVTIVEAAHRFLDIGRHRTAFHFRVTCAKRSQEMQRAFAFRKVQGLFPRLFEEKKVEHCLLSEDASLRITALATSG